MRTILIVDDSATVRMDLGVIVARVRALLRSVGPLRGDANSRLAPKLIEGLGAGADDFLSKASGFDVLSARIQAQIRRKQIEDEQRAVREQLLRSEPDAAEARAAKALAETRAAMAEELKRKNLGGRLDRLRCEDFFHRAVAPLTSLPS